MPTRTAYPARPRRGPLRSPLAAATHSPSAAIRPGASPDRGVVAVLCCCVQERAQSQLEGCD
jgi:hypothetical protein